MSFEESLFISKRVVSDIGQRPPSHEIVMVRGNLGRAGFTLLAYPEPRQVSLKEYDSSQWRIVNHQRFDGKLEDCFESISLHLTFTGWETTGAALTSQSSYKHVDLTILEAVISAHTAGRWLADISPWWMLETTGESGPGSATTQIIGQISQCDGQEAGIKPDREMVALENWEELLDPPGDLAVFKSLGNWQARLASAYICYQKRIPTFVFRNHGCWKCALAILDQRAAYGLALGLRGPRPPPPANSQSELEHESSDEASDSDKSFTNQKEEEGDAPDDQPSDSDSDSSDSEVDLKAQFPGSPNQPSNGRWPLRAWQRAVFIL
jgi:hypothetical protein